MRLVRWTGLVLLVTGVAAVATGTLWYRLDRPAALAAACRIGLPNFSRPKVIEAHEIGCHILGPKRRVRGVLVSAFEVSSLDSADLGTPPKGGGFGGTWYSSTRSSKGSEALDRQLAKPIPGLCGIGFASVTVEGWATLSPGHYGHMGIYSREFFADRVIAVGPPPANLLDRVRAEYRKAGFTGKECAGL